MRAERIHDFGTYRWPAGAIRPRPSGLARLWAIVRELNPSGNGVNCGHSIDIVVHRLTGSNATAVSHNIGLGGSFEQIATRHGTSFTWHHSLDGIFGIMQSGGHGTIALVGIIYSTSGAHVVTIGNVDGVVGICEGQDWAAHMPPEVVSESHRAIARYNSSGANNLGLAVIRWGCPPRVGWEASDSNPRLARPRAQRYGV